MKMKWWFLGGIIVLLAIGCKEKELPVLHVNQEMLPYCWFPTGSYWIYEEESTPGLMDSVYVRSAWTSVDPDMYDEGYETEFYGSTIVMQGKIWGQSRIPWSFNDESGDVFTEFSEGYSDSTGNVDNIVFFWNPRDNSRLPSTSSSISMTYYDSITVNFHTFFDAYLVNNPKGQYTTSSIWARNVGVIKRTLNNGTTWNLTRFHIN